MTRRRRRYASGGYSRWIAIAGALFRFMPAGIWLGPHPIDKALRDALLVASPR